MSSIGRIRRIISLLERLQSGRRYNSAQLAEFEGVSKRTVFRDISVLKETGVQIFHDDTTQGYWIASSNSPPRTQLSFDEILSLLILAEHASKATHSAPYQLEARSAAQKLLLSLSESVRVRLCGIVDRTYVTEEPTRIYRKGDDHYKRALQAMDDRHRMRLTYVCQGNGKRESTLVSIYGVICHDNAWHIIGRSSLHRSTQSFRVDQILTSAINSGSYEIPPRFSLDRHFSGACRVA